MKRNLHISSKLALPPDAVTSTIVVYGGKGMGKTNFASTLVEEFAAARLRFAVVDPMGVWWGLRYGADGKSHGIPVLILGGIHGDLPIAPEAGALVADLVVDEDASVIIDISRRADGSMWAISERIRFVRDYAKRIYQRQGEKRRPIHQVIDEAARFAPQLVRQGESEVAACMGAIAVLVEEGRNVGIGVTLVTQRSARLNKDVAELADCMISFRIVGPNSMRAVLDWLGEHVEKARFKEIGEQLRSLPRGSALVVSPGWLEFEGIVPMRMRETFDSSKTPEAGKQLRTVGDGAKIDVAKYHERLADLIEQQKTNDPKLLRGELAKLQGKLVAFQLEIKHANIKLEAERSKYERMSALASEEGQRASKPTKMVDPKKLEAAVGKIDAAYQKFTGASEATTTFLRKMHDELKATEKLIKQPTVAFSEAAISRVTASDIEKLKRATSTTRIFHRNVKPEKMILNGTSTRDESERKLTPAHLRLLSAIAWWNAIGVDEPDLNGVAFIAGTSASSGAYKNNRAYLNAGGYISYPRSGHVRLLDKGAAVAPDAGIEISNRGVQTAVREKLTPAVARVLDTLIAVYPAALELEELANRAGASITSGAFKNNRAFLNARNLAEYPRPGVMRAGSLLFPERESQ